MNPMQIVLSEYRRWRDCDVESEPLYSVAMGAAGACANIIAALAGLTEPPAEDSSEVSRICESCHGTGRVELTDVYKKTYDLLLEHGEMHGAALARLDGCTNEAMCNRLRTLEDAGAVSSRRNGRNRYYRVLEPGRRPAERPTLYGVWNGLSGHWYRVSNYGCVEAFENQEAAENYIRSIPLREKYKLEAAPLTPQTIRQGGNHAAADA